MISGIWTDLTLSCCSWSLPAEIILFQHCSVQARLRTTHTVPGVSAQLWVVCQWRGPASLWGNIRGSDPAPLVCQDIKTQGQGHGLTLQLFSTLYTTPRRRFLIQLRNYLFLLGNWMLDIFLAEPPAGCRRHLSKVNISRWTIIIILCWWNGCCRFQMADITYILHISWADFENVFFIALFCVCCWEKIRDIQ